METEAVLAIFKEYGIINVVIMLITTILVNFIKIPIKRRSDKIIAFAKGLDLDLDKTVINNCITYLPFVIIFILLTIKELIITYNDLTQYDYIGTFIDAIVYGGMSMGVYELISSNLKKIKFRKNYKSIIENYCIQRKFDSGDLPKLSDDDVRQENIEKVNENFEENGNEKL